MSVWANCVKKIVIKTQFSSLDFLKSKYLLWWMVIMLGLDEFAHDFKELDEQKTRKEKPSAISTHFMQHTLHCIISIFNWLFLHSLFSSFFLIFPLCSISSSLLLSRYFFLFLFHFVSFLYFSITSNVNVLHEWSQSRSRLFISIAKLLIFLVFPRQNEFILCK